MQQHWAFCNHPKCWKPKFVNAYHEDRSENLPCINLECDQPVYDYRLTCFLFDECVVFCVCPHTPRWWTAFCGPATIVFLHQVNGSFLETATNTTSGWRKCHTMKPKVIAKLWEAIWLKKCSQKRILWGECQFWTKCVRIVAGCQRLQVSKESTNRLKPNKWLRAAAKHSHSHRVCE